MNDKNELDQKLNKTVKSVLDRRADNLSDETVRELQFIRQQALQKEKPDWKSRPETLWLGGAGMVATSVAIVFILLFRPGIDSSLPRGGQELFELMAATEELEFYEQMEFYQWLEQESAGDKQNS